MLRDVIRGLRLSIFKSVVTEQGYGLENVFEKAGKYSLYYRTVERVFQPVFGALVVHLQQFMLH